MRLWADRPHGSVRIVHNVDAGVTTRLTRLEEIMNDQESYERELWQMQADDYEAEQRAKVEIDLIHEMCERYGAMLQLARSRGEDGPEVDWVEQQRDQLLDTLELLARYGTRAL